MERISKNDAYERINTRILSMMNAGQVPWNDPDRLNTEGTSYRSYVTGKEYSLLNRLMLPKPGYYLTFNQVKEQGGSVNKGARSEKISFYRWVDAKPADPEPGDADGDAVQTAAGKKYPLFREYGVFNVEDCTGIKPREAVLSVKYNRPMSDVEDIACRYLADRGFRLKLWKSTGHAFAWTTRELSLCPRGCYKSSEDYYKDLLYEIIHSTGGAGELKRTSTMEETSNPYYKVMEDLVCEIGSVYLSGMLGIDTSSVYTYSVSRLQNWADEMESHPRMFVHACNQAEKAAKYVIEHSQAAPEAQG